VGDAHIRSTHAPDLILDCVHEGRKVQKEKRRISGETRPEGRTHTEKKTAKTPCETMAIRREDEHDKYEGRC